MDAVKKVEELMQDEEFIGLYDKEERDLDDRLAAEQYNKKLGLEQGKEEGIVIGRIEGREEGRIEGRVEGLEQGREEGQNQERKIMIKRMAESNFSIPQIASLYQISSKEVHSYLSK